MNIDTYHFNKYSLTVGPKSSITIKNKNTGQTVYIRDGDVVLNYIFNGAIVNNLQLIEDIMEKFGGKH